MARRPIVHIQVWPNARERRVVERLVIQTRISGGTFSGCGARFSVPPQASACGEPARRAEARRSTLKRAPRGTSRPFTYTQMYRAHCARPARDLLRLAEYGDRFGHDQVWGGAPDPRPAPGSPHPLIVTVLREPQ